MAIKDNLIHWYDGDDGVDDHGSDNLTANGNATNTSGSGGKVGEAFDIPNTGTDYWEITGPTDIAFSATDDRTFAFWVKRNTGSTRDRIMGIWSDFGGLNSDKNFLFLFWDSGEIRMVGGSDLTTGTSTSGTTNVSDNAWHFVVITYSGSIDDKFRLYIDGATTAEATSATESSLNGSNQDFRIGGVDSLPFDGQLDSLGIWSRVITSDEITALYNSGSGRDYTGLDDIGGGSNAFSQTIILT